MKKSHDLVKPLLGGKRMLLSVNDELYWRAAHEGAKHGMSGPQFTIFLLDRVLPKMTTGMDVGPAVLPPVEPKPAEPKDAGAVKVTEKV